MHRCPCPEFGVYRPLPPQGNVVLFRTKAVMEMEVGRRRGLALLPWELKHLNDIFFLFRVVPGF